MLFAGLVLGSLSMVKAAGNYFDDPMAEAKKYFSIFEKEVEKELNSRKYNPESFHTLDLMDRMLECTLFPDDDIYYQSNEEIEDFMLDVYEDAFKRASKRFDMGRFW